MPPIAATFSAAEAAEGEQRQDEADGACDPADIPSVRKSAHGARQALRLDSSSVDAGDHEHVAHPRSRRAVVCR